MKTVCAFPTHRKSPAKRKQPISGSAHGIRPDSNKILQIVKALENVDIDLLLQKINHIRQLELPDAQDDSARDTPVAHQHLSLAANTLIRTSLSPTDALTWAEFIDSQQCDQSDQLLTADPLTNQMYSLLVPDDLSFRILQETTPFPTATGLDLGSPPLGGLNAVDSSDIYTVSCTASIADELLGLYFTHVQGYLPLFHRPSFEQHYHEKLRSLIANGDSLPPSSAFILNGIFALSARFSKSADLESIEARDRGVPFARRAFQSFKIAFRHVSEHPTLETLQGGILVTYYTFNSEPSWEGFGNVALLCQMAFTLSLHRIDEATESVQMLCPELYSEWRLNEEKRRAWWAIWELDTFASVISRRPFMIQMDRVRVRLPVSDVLWFENTAINSPRIEDNKPLDIWRTLETSSNQSEYAWYLVAHSHLRWAHEYYESRTASLGHLTEFLKAIKSFCLSLPPTFDLLSPTMTARLSHTVRNHVMTTHLMIRKYGIFAWLTGLFLTPGASSASIVTVLISKLQREISGAEGTSSRIQSSVSYSNLAETCHGYSLEVLRVIGKYWTPNTVAFCSPWLACAIAGPASIHIGGARDASTDLSYARYNSQSNFDRQPLLHVMMAFAEVWNIAQHMLVLVNAIGEDNVDALLVSRDKKMNFLTSLQAFIPSMISE
ncbi:fungal-specific transcription factor domain-containing protein [Xylogone sp. PMI_703]|nr:fungal-specific transcription factor domain-containing protein [Xylogone sp. PMI_703]